MGSQSKIQSRSMTASRSKTADFSGVLFQSDFVLASKKNHMKTHKNQWVWAAPHLPEPLSEAISRGPTVAPEAQKPSQCLDRVRPHSDRGLQLLENKALSWGIIRKSACILAEITIRKSQTGLKTSSRAGMSGRGR